MEEEEEEEEEEDRLSTDSSSSSHPPQTLTDSSIILTAAAEAHAPSHRRSRIVADPRTTADPIHHLPHPSSKPSSVHPSSFADLPILHLVYYIGLAVVASNLAELTFSWCERKAKEIKSGKGKDAAAVYEIDTIHRIIDMKGKAAKRMTVLELAKELRYYEVTEGIWSEFLCSS